MASELDAAAERWGGGHFNAGDGKLLADWAVARLAADRAEREELARHVLEVRCDGNGYDWLRDGEMVQARIGFNDPAVPALMLLGVKRKGGAE